MGHRQGLFLPTNILHRLGKSAVNRFGGFVQGVENLDRKRGAIILKAAQEVRPFVIRQLLAQYQKSGLKSQSGELLTAIKSSTVEFTAGGLQVRIGGTSNKLMVKSAALNYGAVFAPHLWLKKIDLPTGESRGYSVRSVLGDKSKRTVKRAVFGNSRGYKIILSKRQKLAQGAIESETLRYLKPRWFYTLSSAARDAIVAEFISIVKREMTACGLEVK